MVLATIVYLEVFPVQEKSNSFQGIWVTNSKPQVAEDVSFYLLQTEARSWYLPYLFGVDMGKKLQSPQLM